MKSKSTKWIIISAILSLLIYLLAFHNVICQDQWKVFPKESLTFSNAFVNSEDVRKILVDYNKASLIEKVQISNSSLFRILMKEGCIVIKEKSLSCNCK